MKKIFVYLFIFFTGFLLYANYPKSVSAQGDDPRYDQVPDYVRNQNYYFNTEGGVVTINDYDNFDLGVDFAEVHIAMNPRNPLESIAAWINLSSSIGARGYYTIDGLNWTVTPNPSWGAPMIGDPVLAYDSLNNVYLDNLISGLTSGTKVARSNSNGQTWGSVVAGGVGSDKNWIACDQTAGPYANYTYQTITNAAFNACNFSRSTDNGATFTLMTSLTPHSLPGAMVCVGPNGSIQGGNVFVVTIAGSSFASSYSFFKSTDGGVTFSNMSTQFFPNYVGSYVNGRNSVQNMRTRPYPFICADNSFGPYRGRLYLIYTSNNPSGNGNKPDIFSRYSADEGVTWSAELVVNDDPDSQNNNQWMPAPWCDKETGKLYVQWMDTRDCPTSDSCLIYASYSTDGGQTFVPNQQISNKKFRVNCTQCNGGTPAYLGDYNGISSNSKTSILAWTDFRNNNFGNYVAYFPDFAMRTNPTSISIDNGNTTSLRVVIPSVKLYTDNVTFSGTVTPSPSGGALTVSFPEGNTLDSYPDSLPVSIYAAPNTTSGNYTVAITARGSNGTPVHKRDVALNVGSVGINEINEIPGVFSLSQNYPNPFNPTTRIDYALKFKSDVKLSVFDAVGRLVASISKGIEGSGSYFVNFNGAKLSSGIYYYKLETEHFTDTKKMLLIK